ncbi:MULTISPECIES: hypothetical protein [Rhizobium]|uniref:DUF3299 domain-containing protein n=1 Tax=Rhizobium wenxiniae TaxID=1737357 RepID=A0A7W9Y8J8_9HYPH|nr:hypothetical protein [Rhizobium wenxiniae]GGG03499.1 hypothetical protein GCM10010924_35070 [Rhizobium wenxiniae]
MNKLHPARFNRRQALTMTLGLVSGLPLLAAAGRAEANNDITFDELYGKVSVLGLEFSDKVKQLNGKEIAMRGFMAPPLKAEAQFFVLTEIPMSICPFCSTDSDWPDNIVVVYLGEKQTFTQPSQTIEVRGKLEMGSWTDPETGFVSLLRIRQAEYATV